MEDFLDEDFLDEDFFAARFFGAAVLRLLVAGLELRVVFRLAMAEIVARRFGIEGLLSRNYYEKR